MFERFTDRARRVVVLAQEEARLLDHDHIGTEHLLLGLIHEGEGIGALVLESLGIGLQDVRREVEAIIGRGSEPARERIPFTPRAKKILELSLRESQELGQDHIGTEHILLGLAREAKGVGAQVLEGLGAELRDLRGAVIGMLGEGEAEPEAMEAFHARPSQGRIELRGVRVFAHHGAMPEEQQEGQELLIDLVIHLHLGRAASSDDLRNTVDYAALARSVAQRVTAGRWNLLERVAQEVADLVLEDGRVHGVEVTVHKPQAPLEVPVDDVAVTFVRWRR